MKELLKSVFGEKIVFNLPINFFTAKNRLSYIFNKDITIVDSIFDRISIIELLAIKVSKYLQLPIIIEPFFLPINYLDLVKLVFHLNDEEKQILKFPNILVSTIFLWYETGIFYRRENDSEKKESFIDLLDDRISNVLYILSRIHEFIYLPYLTDEKGKDIFTKKNVETLFMIRDCIESTTAGSLLAYHLKTFINLFISNYIVQKLLQPFMKNYYYQFKIDEDISDKINAHINEYCKILFFLFYLFSYDIKFLNSDKVNVEISDISNNAYGVEFYVLRNDNLLDVSRQFIIHNADSLTAIEEIDKFVKESIIKSKREYGINIRPVNIIVTSNHIKIYNAADSKQFYQLSKYLKTRIQQYQKLGMFDYIHNTKEDKTLVIFKNSFKPNTDILFNKLMDYLFNY